MAARCRQRGVARARRRETFAASRSPYLMRASRGTLQRQGGGGTRREQARDGPWCVRRASTRQRVRTVPRGGERERATTTCLPLLLRTVRVLRRADRCAKVPRECARVRWRRLFHATACRLWHSARDAPFRWPHTHARSSRAHESPCVSIAPRSSQLPCCCALAAVTRSPARHPCTRAHTRRPRRRRGRRPTRPAATSARGRRPTRRAATSTRSRRRTLSTAMSAQ